MNAMNVSFTPIRSYSLFADSRALATREKFTEMRYLEKSIGPTGILALAPMLHMSHKDLWQLYMLGKR